MLSLKNLFLDIFKIPRNYDTQIWLEYHSAFQLRWSPQTPAFDTKRIITRKWRRTMTVLECVVRVGGSSLPKVHWDKASRLVLITEELDSGTVTCQAGGRDGAKIQPICQNKPTEIRLFLGSWYWLPLSPWFSIPRNKCWIREGSEPPKIYMFGTHIV